MVEFLQEEISVIAKNIQKNELTITIDNECYILGDIKYKTKQKENKEKLSTNNIDKFFDGIANCLDADKNTNIPLICHYQTNRNIHSISLGIRKQNRCNQLAALEGSLLKKGEGTDFGDFFKWFRNREDLENEKFRDFHEEAQYKTYPHKKYPRVMHSDSQLNAVRNALELLVPEYHSLRVRRSPLRMVVTKGEEEFRLEELSDGEKCLLVLIADMARRMAMANPAMENPLEAEAVFLIDEIELHLHPSWQRRILPGLLRVFPHSQFFVTTHSPQVLGEVEDTQSIWCMVQGIQPYHPERAYGLTSGEILGELMGTADRSAVVEKELDHINSLIDEEKFDEARQQIRNLAQKTKNIPSLLYFNTILTMLGEEQVDLENCND